MSKPRLLNRNIDPGRTYTFLQTGRGAVGTHGGVGTLGRVVPPSTSMVTTQKFLFRLHLLVVRDSANEMKSWQKETFTGSEVLLKFNA